MADTALAETEDEEVKVLLIEDDETSAEMYRSRLSADGYTVIVASDGQAGLEMAARDKPDLIYLDLRLPKKDGFEVLEHLRADARTAAIPAIILSNFGEPELRARGLELGALEFLVKSDTTPASLVETTQRWHGATTQPSASG
jgi:DNA-binding response OmpR family regulator